MSFVEGRLAGQTHQGTFLLRVSGGVSWPRRRVLGSVELWRQVAHTYVFHLSFSSVYLHNAYEISLHRIKLFSFVSLYIIGHMVLNYLKPVCHHIYLELESQKRIIVF